MADWWLGIQSGGLEQDLEPSLLRQTHRYPYWPEPELSDRDLVAPVEFGRDAVRLDPRYHTHRRSIPVELLNPRHRLRQIFGTLQPDTGVLCDCCGRQIQAWWWLWHFGNQNRLCADCACILELVQELHHWPVHSEVHEGQFSLLARADIVAITTRLRERRVFSQAQFAAIAESRNARADAAWRARNQWEPDSYGTLAYGDDPVFRTLAGAFW